MDSTIISSLIGAGAMLLSALISANVAKTTTRKELERMEKEHKLTNQSEKKRAFADMVKALDFYILQVSQGEILVEQETPLKAIANARILFSGTVAEAIDALQTVFQEDADLGTLRRCLAKAIDENRRDEEQSR